MLNGQLQLTEMNPGAQVARLRRPLFVAGALSLAILAGCASKGTRAPVVDLTGSQGASSAQPGGSSSAVTKCGPKAPVSSKFLPGVHCGALNW